MFMFDHPHHRAYVAVRAERRIRTIEEPPWYVVPKRVRLIAG